MLGLASKRKRPQCPSSGRMELEIEIELLQVITNADFI